MAALLAACGGGGSGASTAAADPNTRFLVEHMQANYLWADQLPATIDPARYASDEAALAALKVAADRFSSIANESDFNSFTQAGQLTGYGFSYTVGKEALVLTQVQAQAPAWQAGLRRGDEILAIDGRSIASFANAGEIDSAIGPSTAGISGTYRVQTPLPGGTGYAPARDVAMTKAAYNVTYVSAASTLPSSAGTVGYIDFYSFTGNDLVAWNNALSLVIAQGARHLVLDLRDNGGGLIADAVNLASSLGPSGSADPSPASLTGKLAVSLRHNSRQQALDQDFRFNAQALAGRFGQVVVITSARTCSASELLIQALKPYRNVQTIGQTTCGKPFGSTPATYNGRVYSILSFRVVNSVGETDYVDGLSPTCALTDPVMRSLGDPAERLLAGALKLIETGVCPSAAALPKSSGPPGRTGLQPAAMSGLDRETGLK